GVSKQSTRDRPHAISRPAGERRRGAAHYSLRVDRLLILNQQHLERILEVFVDHYNGHRPHRALSLAPAPWRSGAVPTPSFGDARISRRDRSAVSSTSTRWCTGVTPASSAF